MHQPPSAGRLQAEMGPKRLVRVTVPRPPSGPETDMRQLAPRTGTKESSAKTSKGGVTPGRHSMLDTLVVKASGGQVSAGHTGPSRWQTRHSAPASG